MSHDPTAALTSGPASIHTTDGLALEAEAHLPSGPVAAMVITHPHPTYGGSMHTPIPSLLFRESGRLDVAAVRFNFRGVGRSEGSHDRGVGERLDVLAAVAALRAAVGPEVPLAVGGWSFGADVALAADSDDIAGWLAVAAPLGVVPPEEMAAARSPRPKLLLVPEHDQFRSPASAAETTATWPNTTIETIAGNDHFLATGLADVAAGYERFVGLVGLVGGSTPR